MHRSYSDIISRIDEPVLWWDEHAVPRYDPFHPMLMGVYEKAAGLYEIACQACDERFQVGMAWGIHAAIFESTREMPDPLTWHYGDPPIHGRKDGCAAGDTMNSIPLRIIQFWIRNKKTEYVWIRQREIETDNIEVMWDEKEILLPKEDHGN